MSQDGATSRKRPFLAGILIGGTTHSDELATHSVATKVMYTIWVMCGRYSLAIEYDALEDRFTLRYRKGLASVIDYQAANPGLFSKRKIKTKKFLSRAKKEAIWNTWQRFLDYMLALDQIRGYHGQFWRLRPGCGISAPTRARTERVWSVPARAQHAEPRGASG